MKVFAWLLPILSLALLLGLFCLFTACGGDESEDEEAEPEDEEEEDQLPPCEYPYPSSPIGDGTVEINGLEWTAYDNGEDIDHNCAEHYVADLDYDGKDDWRLPTIAELAALYDSSDPQPVNCEEYQANINDAFVITCYLMWSNEEGEYPGTQGYKAYSFIGAEGQLEGSEQILEFDHRPNMRVLAVRDL